MGEGWVMDRLVRIDWTVENNDYRAPGNKELS
jgi:hypothetical protein